MSRTPSYAVNVLHASHVPADQLASSAQPTQMAFLDELLHLTFKSLHHSKNLGAFRAAPRQAYSGILATVKPKSVKIYTADYIGKNYSYSGDPFSSALMGPPIRLSSMQAVH